MLSKHSSVEEIESYTYNEVNPIDEIPEYFNEINKLIFANGKPIKDSEIVKKMGVWLKKHIKGGPGLSEPSEQALKIMISGKGGVCSDRAQVFNNFCVINNIKVREWGSTRGPYHKAFGGHSFNEVFCNDLNKWVLVDISYCIMFYFESDTPLSVVQLYENLRENKKITYKAFEDSFEIKAERITRNYLEPDTIPFLVCNYSNKTYDKYLSFFRPYVPVFIIHFIIYVFGKSYHYRFPLDDYRKIYN
ncbi:transglutaminase domain-containing protein [Hanstruepera ponticola]|uniref:transglutaminase domain-containing protein n=1 Tax=Hanstruepera ponticola TaxID=2042995 RepID=UPI0013C48C97|nr:transglutaminase domain-containing protein [Hanstruepera ponticola]